MAKARITIEVDIKSLEEMEDEVQKEINEDEISEDRSFTHEDILENIGLYNHGSVDGFELIHMINDSDACDSYFFLDKARIINKEFIDEGENEECQR